MRQQVNLTALEIWQRLGKYSVLALFEKLDSFKIESIALSLKGSGFPHLTWPNYIKQYTNEKWRQIMLEYES